VHRGGTAPISSSGPSSPSSNPRVWLCASDAAAFSLKAGAAVVVTAVAHQHQVGDGFSSDTEGSPSRVVSALGRRRLAALLRGHMSGAAAALRVVAVVGARGSLKAAVARAAVAAVNNDPAARNRITFVDGSAVLRPPRRAAADGAEDHGGFLAGQAARTAAAFFSDAARLCSEAPPAGASSSEASSCPLSLRQEKVPAVVLFVPRAAARDPHLAREIAARIAPFARDTVPGRAVTVVAGCRPEDLDGSSQQVTGLLRSALARVVLGPATPAEAAAVLRQSAPEVAALATGMYHGDLERWRVIAEAQHHQQHHSSDGSSGGDGCKGKDGADLPPDDEAGACCCCSVCLVGTHARAHALRLAAGVTSMSVPAGGAPPRVFGHAAAKRRLEESLAWPLRHSRPFLRLGVTAPSGVLLHGPPGTGKTLLAAAAAAHAGAKFISADIAAFASSYVGGPEREVRRIFRLARSLAPCVVFLDEIQAVFATRGAAEPRGPQNSRTGHHEEDFRGGGGDDGDREVDGRDEGHQGADRDGRDANLAADADLAKGAELALDLNNDDDDGWADVADDSDKDGGGGTDDDARSLPSQSSPPSPGGAPSTVLSQLLVEMDRSVGAGVCVVAATNLLSAVDAALRRPGRLEHEVFVGPLGKSARRGLIAATWAEADVEAWTARTRGWTGAEIVAALQLEAREQQVAPYLPAAYALFGCDPATGEVDPEVWARL
jgi:hypothetical protein